MTRFSTLLRPLALAAALLLFVVPDAEAQAIWRGRSAGFDVTWGADDVSARRVSDGRLVFSLKRRFEKEWTGPRDPDDNEVREVGQSFRVLSLVGSVISLEDVWYCDCGGAHPISYSRFVAYDLARSTADSLHPARITDLVPEAPLLRALTSDRVIRAVMDSAEVREARSLAALLDAAQWEGVHVETPGEENDCTFNLSDGFPTHFAFHHVENGQLAIRFSLSHDVEICRGRMVQVGVLVPVPPRLQSALTAADGRTTGYLMKDVRRIAGERWTHLNWPPEQ
jgi:hypothetical protein